MKYFLLGLLLLPLSIHAQEDLLSSIDQEADSTTTVSAVFKGLKNYQFRIYQNGSEGRLLFCGIS